MTSNLINILSSDGSMGPSIMMIFEFIYQIMYPKATTEFENLLTELKKVCSGHPNYPQSRTSFDYNKMAS